MLTEKKELANINVKADCVQVYTDTVIESDGAEVARSTHLHMIRKGDDYSKEAEQVKKICAALWG
jgi:hypothetical protein